MPDIKKTAERLLSARKRVVRYETRVNDGPSRELFPEHALMVLECGHVINLGASRLRPKLIACWECAAEQGWQA